MKKIGHIMERVIFGNFKAANFGRETEFGLVFKQKCDFISECEEPNFLEFLKTTKAIDSCYSDFTDLVALV